MCIGIAGVFGMLGSMVSAMGAMAQADAQAQQAEYNAKVAEINARTARQAGLANADQKEDEYDSLRGRQRAAAASAGVRPGSGSAALIINDKAYRDEYLDTANIIWDAETKGVGHENEATRYRMEADAHRKAGGIAAFGTVLGGMSKMVGQGSTLRIG